MMAVEVLVECSPMMRRKQGNPAFSIELVKLPCLMNPSVFEQKYKYLSHAYYSEALNRSLTKYVM